MKDSGIDITDIFCGCGGSSTGATMANDQVNIRMAINHWNLAVESHNTNHPTTDHDCCDVSACDPRRYPSTRILWASPECTNHSLAKGKRRSHQGQIDVFDGAAFNPAEERSRATMWDVPRFTEFHQYDMVVVENVVDARRWAMWPAWIHAMRCLGYEHEAVYLNSMFAYPTPQSRDRVYVVFWRKGVKKPDLAIRPRCWCERCGTDVDGVQAWRDTPIGRERWGKYGQQYDLACPRCASLVQPYYYAAFNCIDWSIQGERIGDRSRPLAEKTMDRIRYGLEKYGRRPLFIETTHGGRKRVYADQIPTQTGRQSLAILNPPFLSMQYTTESARGVDALAGAVTATDHHALVAPPYMVELRGTGSAKPVTDHLGCVTAGGNNHAIVSRDSVRAFLATYYSSGNGASGMNEPYPTATTVDRNALIGVDADSITVEDCTFRMLKPHEIQAAMAFPSDYVVLGNQRDKVKQLGNAVTPPAARDIMKRCIEALS